MLRCCWKVLFRAQPFQQRHFSTLPLSRQQQQGKTSVRVAVKELEREREGERLHKVIANTGLCSRRQAELLIKKHRVFVNGKPASGVSLVTAEDVITIDGNKLNNEETKLWLHNKKSGVLVTTNSKEDYKGRRVLFREFERMYVPPSAHIAVDPLKYNAEGCMLLTNNGALAKYLESASTGFERRHKVLVYGNVCISISLHSVYSVLHFTANGREATRVRKRLQSGRSALSTSESSHRIRHTR